ncbi:hypothetical protein CCACVL1_19646 [Corchorus capsularis]|uniref:Uncharacterized protein n=1 Tax=Corchorus capsularis TaxID=210143 RepID=A0A1R3HFK7_COCAP|nr:hypothetical protein CCACVL1_19646 [Corchorus capsularis]
MAQSRAGRDQAMARSRAINSYP